MDAPDEREQTHELKVGLTANTWFPISASFGRTVTKRWRNRVEQLSDETAAASGLDLEQIARRAEEDERVGDMITSAAERATRVADADYRSALARLLAAGLRDDARVDDAVFYTATLISLEPLHLRVLRVVSDVSPRAPVDVAEHPDVKAAKSIAYSAAHRLKSLGLLDGVWDYGGVYSMGDEIASITEAGREFLRFCEAADDEHRQ